MDIIFIVSGLLALWRCVRILPMTTTIVFMGSPDFAVPTLKGLFNQYNIKGVVTQPDKPAGRGKVLRPSPIKFLALSLGIPVIQPQKLSLPEAMDQLLAWRPDLIVVTAFGQILRQAVLDLPPEGCINVHASLLPRWRGAAPIQAAMINGDQTTGVTIMRMDAGVDSGPIVSQRAVPISQEDTAATLSERLAQTGADLLIETLPAYLNGSIKPIPQDPTLATRAPMLKKENGLLDFNEHAEKLALKVRGYNPWPGAYFIWDNQILKVHRAHSTDRLLGGVGLFSIIDGKPAVGTGCGLFVLDEVQPAGKKTMTGEAFLRGARNWVSP